ncbi:MAG: translocation/assembly module TamB domain-containing protein [bacterium]
MKTRKTKAYIFYSIILFIVIAIIVIVESNILESVFKGKIERFITEKTGAKVSIGRIDVSILSSSVTFTSLVLKYNANYKADIGKLTVVFEPPSVLKKKPQLKTVYINNANVFIVLPISQKTSSGIHNKTSIPDINSLGMLLPVSIKHVVVNNTALSLSIPALDTNVKAKNISMNMYPAFSEDRISSVVEIKGVMVARSKNVISLSDIQFNGLLKNRNIIMNSLRIRSDSLNCEMRGSIENYLDPYLNLYLKVSVKDIQQYNGFLKTLPINIPELSGTYRFEGNIAGTVFNPSSSGEIYFQDMKIGKIKGGTGNVSYVFKSQKLHIKKANVSIANGTVEFDGTIDFSNDEIPAEFSVNLDRVSFGDLLYSLTVPDPYVDSSISGHVEVKGRFNPVYFAGGVNINFNKFSVYDNFFKAKKKYTVMIVKPVNVHSGLILTNQCAYITGATVSSNRSILHTDTALYFTGAMFLRFESTQLDMQDVSPIASIPYTGIGDVKGYIAGPFKDIVIHGDVSFRDYSMEYIKLGNVDGGITFSGDTLSLEHVTAVKGDSKMYVNGGVQFTSPIELHMSAKLESVLLSEIADNIGYKFTTNGSINGSVNIDGPIANMNGKADLYLSHPDIYFQSFDNGEIMLAMNDGRFNIDSAIFTKGNDTFHAKGYITEAGDIGLEFYTEEFNLTNLDITKFVPYVKGTLALSGNITGTVVDPVGAANIKLTNLSYKETYIPEINAAINFSHDTFSSMIESFNHALSIKAELDTIKSYPFRLRANFKNFNAQNILPASSGMNFTSDISGTFWLVGKLDNIPDSLVGYVYIDNLYVGNGVLGLESSKPLFMDIARDNIYFREFALKGKNSSVELNGFFNLKGSIDTLINADVDLGYLPLFTNILAGSDGALKLNLRVYGEKDHISFNGNAELNGNATFSEEPVSLSNVHISAIMANNNVIIKDVNGNINSGSMTGSGRIIMSDLLPKMFDISIDLKGVNFVYDNTIPLQFDGVLELEGDYPQPVLNGNIKILNATYTDYINWEDELIKFQRRRYEPQSIEKKKTYPLKLNVDIKSNNSIVIDNNIVSTTLSADLKIEGDIDNPVIVGNISTSEGKLYYRSTVFNIDNAVVTYTREHPHQPFVDIRASTSQQFMVNNEYTDYRIYLTIAGELNKLNISLTSYPPNLDEMDIISLLTYGVTLSDLMKSGIGSAAAYEVGSAVGSKLAKDIFSELVGRENLNTFRKIFWIDNLQIEPYYPIGAPSTSIRLTVTKKFTNDFNILYSYDLSGYNLQRFQGEYRLSKGLYFVGSWNNGITAVQSNPSNNSVGNFGGDLKYRFEF